MVDPCASEAGPVGHSLALLKGGRMFQRGCMTLLPFGKKHFILWRVRDVHVVRAHFPLHTGTVLTRKTIQLARKLPFRTDGGSAASWLTKAFLAKAGAPFPVRLCGNISHGTAMR